MEHEQRDIVLPNGKLLCASEYWGRTKSNLFWGKGGGVMKDGSLGFHAKKWGNGQQNSRTPGRWSRRTRDYRGRWQNKAWAA